MAFVYPEAVINEVKSANDIHAVVSEYVQLKRSGNAYKGLCPFHSEKSASFFVNPERQIFHCFGCGIGGDVVAFIMQYERINFAEALRSLAGRAGISLPAAETRDRREEDQNKKIYKMNTLATQYYRRQLMDSQGSKEALAYLSARGINAEGINAFGIGWSPTGWENLRRVLHKEGFEDEVMALAGLIVPRQGRGGYYDRFRGRIIFPIANARGEIVAFGGRAIDSNQEPKYLNTPETPVYHKSNILYGLDRAKTRIREAGYGVIVEGYFDLITAHLAGMTNTVATCGTALTREHLRLLKRFCGKVVLIYDGDAAGMEATKRSLEVFLEEDMTVNSVALPDGHDPDSFIRKEGVDAFRGILRKSVPLMDFYIRRSAEKWLEEGIDGKARAAAEIISMLAKIPGPVKKSEYARRAAAVLDVREEALLAELRSTARREGSRSQAVAGPGPSSRRPFVEEEELVRAMLLDRSLAAKIKSSVPTALFRDDVCRSVAEAVYDLLDREQGETVPPAPNLEDTQAASLAARLIAEGDRSADLARLVDDCLAKKRRSGLTKELREIQEKINRAEHDKRNDLVDDLLRIKQNIARA